MAGPGGKEIGRVSVRVVPDTSRFGVDVERYLKRVERTLKVSIPTKLDTTGIKTDLAKLAVELKAFGAKNTLNIKTSMDSSGVKKALTAAKAEAKAEAAKDPVKVKVTTTTDDFFREIRKKGKALAAQAALDLPVDTDGEVLRQKLAKLTKDLEKKTSVKVPVDAAQAATARQSVTRIVRQIQKIASEARPAAITATVRADADAFIGDLKRRAEKAAKAASIELPATIDGEKIRRQLNDLLAKLRNTTNVPIPTTVKETVTLRKDVETIVKEIEAIAARSAPKVPVATKLAVDNDAFLLDLEKLGKRVAAKTELGLPVTPDGEKTRSQLRTLVGDLEKSVRVQIPTTATEAAELRGKVKSIVEHIQKIAASEAPVAAVKIPVAADTDAFIRDLRRKGEKLAAETAIALPIDADGEKVRTTLRKLVEQLHRESNVVLPVDVEERIGMRNKISRIVQDIEGIFTRTTGKVPIEPTVDKSRLRQTIRDVSESFTALRRGLANGFQDISKLLNLKDLGTQLGLITARAAAYATLLGPPILLAAAGAQALAPALATALPFMFGLAASAGVFALTWDRLFGTKGVGGVFQPIIEDVNTLKVALGDIVVTGLDPLIAKLRTTAFPAFAKGMKLVAAAANGAMKEFIGFLTTPQASRAITALLGGAATTLAGLGKSFTSFTSGLLTLSVASLPGLHLLIQGIVNAGQRFDAFMTRVSASGQLQQVITDAVKDTGTFLSAVGRIAVQLGGLLAALRPVAEAVFSALGNALSSVLVGLDNFIQHFTVGPAAAASFTVYGNTLVSVVKDVFKAFDPLLNSGTLDKYFQNAIPLWTSLAIVIRGVSAALSDLVGELLQVIGVPILNFLSSMDAATKPLVDAIGGSRTATELLAASLLLKLVPALLATRAGVAVTAVFTTLGSAMAAFAAAIPAAVAGVRAFGTEVALQGVIDGVAVSVAKLGAVLKAFVLTALAPANLALIGFAAAAFVFMHGMGNINAAAESGKKSFGDLADSVDVFDREKVGQVQEQLRSTIVTGAKFANTYSGLWGQFRAGIDSITNGPLTQLSGQVTGAGEALAKLNERSGNTEANLQLLAKQTGLSRDELAAFADSKDLDLTKAIDSPESARVRAQLISDLDTIQTSTGLTLQSIKDNVGGGIATWTRYSAAVAEVKKKASSAFASDTNIFNVFSPAQLDSANKKVAKSQEALTNKTKKYGQIQDQINAKAAKTPLQQLKNQQRLSNALDGVATAQGKVNDAIAKQNGATLVAQYRGMIKTAQDFVKNLQIAADKGVNTDFLVQAMTAGPQKAGPILAQIVGDSSGALIKMVNKGQAVLNRLSTSMLDKARLIAIASNVGSSRQVVEDLPIALKISAAQDKNPKLTVQQAMKLTGLDEQTIRLVGFEYGSGLREAAQSALKPLKPKVDKAPFQQFVDDVLGTVLHPGITPVVDASPWDRFMGTVNKIFHPIISPFIGAPKTPTHDEGTGHATGGLITGPGTYTSDSIAARLSHMEYVQPAHTVLHYGVEVMEALRAHRIPKQVLLSILNGRRAMAQPVAASAPPRLRVASVMADTGVSSSAPTTEGHPRTLTIVDHDGVFRGQMRVAAVKTHRQRAQAERLRRLGTWG